MSNVDSLLEIASVGLGIGAASVITRQVHRALAARRSRTRWHVSTRPGPMGTASPWLDIALVPLPVERRESRRG